MVDVNYFPEVAFDLGGFGGLSTGEVIGMSQSIREIYPKARVEVLSSPDNSTQVFLRVFYSVEDARNGNEVQAAFVVKAMVITGVKIRNVFTPNSSFRCSELILKIDSPSQDDKVTRVNALWNDFVITVGAAIERWARENSLSVSDYFEGVNHE